MFIFNFNFDCDKHIYNDFYPTNKLMRIKRFILFTFFLFIQKFIFASPPGEQYVHLINSKLQKIDSVSLSEYRKITHNSNRPSPILKYFNSKKKKNKKITAAVLAFPFPFGIVGLHRIYLGTAPYVPVVYIGSMGGIFGVLPFVDFCILILDKEETRYIDNKKVFMWVD